MSLTGEEGPVLSSCISDEPCKQQPLSKIRLSNWMGDLPDEMKSSPLSLIAIPGTHDSFTSAITRRSRISPDGDIYGLLRCLPWFCASCISTPWTVTQHCDMTEQLEYGIRYLDLRVGVRHVSGGGGIDQIDYYLVHGQYADRFVDQLRCIRRFLENNPKEVVLLDVNHAYGFDKIEYVEKCTKMIKEEIGSLLYPSHEQIPSINQMLQSGNQILFISYLQHHDNLFWTQNSIQSPWPNTPNVQKMLTFLKDRYGKRHDPNMLYVHQGILTPDFAYVTRHPCGSVRSLSRPATRAFEQWISQSRAGLKGINITIIDFAVSDSPKYAEEVIKLNYKSLE